MPTEPTPPGRADPALLEKYLRCWGESECLSARSLCQSALPGRCFKHTVIIPCFDERPDFARRLQESALWGQNLLAIVVINQPAHIEGPSRINQQLWAFLAQQPCLGSADNLHIYQRPEADSAWLVVDRFSAGRGLNPKQAVGLARKIGCDIAAQLYLDGYLRSRWLHSTDADVHLPDDYFLRPTAGFSACVYPFNHTLTGAVDAALQAATVMYEQAINYYERGLRYAGSPYAYATLGSAMAVDVLAYCQARGFPKRAGAEDFYLLNKLAKLGPVARLQGLPLQIEARRSDRVPFGTGPAVSQIMALPNPAADYRYYAPDVFDCLRQWLKFAPGLWPALQAGEVNWQPLQGPTLDALRTLGVMEFCGHLRRQTRSAEQGMRAIHEWFDAFRTLKFIRHLQARYYPPKSLAECQAQAPF